MSGVTDWFQAIGSIVQAVGTTAAIVYASRIANRQRDDAMHDRKEENRLRARALALTVRPIVEDWLHNMQNFKDAMRSDAATSISGGIDALHASHVFDVPDILWGNVGRIHLLEAAGDELISAIATASEAGASVDLLHSQMAESDHSTSAKKVSEKIWDNYRALQDHLKIGLWHLEAIIDAHVRKTRREE